MVARGRLHALKTLHDAYARHFGKVIFLAPRKLGEGDILRKKSERELHVRKALRGLDVDFCPELRNDWKDVTYVCVSRILSQRRTLLQEQQVAGVLFIHSDFWLSPAFGIGLDHAKVWSLAIDKATDKWFNHWVGCEDVYSLEKWIHVYNKARALLAQEFSSFSTVSSCRCHAWSDMFYIPSEAWPLWTRAVDIIGSAWAPYNNMTRILWSDMALPLSMQVLRAYSSAQHQKLLCWGGPWPSTNDISFVKRHPCGHKMDLSSERLKDEFLRLWQRS